MFGLTQNFVATPTARVDKFLLQAVLVLAGAGIIAVYSAIGYFAETKAGGDVGALLSRHVFKVGVAFVAMYVFSRLPYRRLAKFSFWAVIGAASLLVLVRLIGTETSGAVRWLEIGFLGFQPSDLAKLALVLHAAVLLTKKQTYITDLQKGLLPILFWTGLLVLLVLIGRDLSTALMLYATVMIMCFVGRARVSHLVLINLALVGVMALGLQSGLLSVPAEHRSRVESWWNPTECSGDGYQACQAKIAVAMGGIDGVGMGKSSRRYHLPEPYTDFIFAIIAEEYGLWGTLIILLAFGVILFRGFLRIARAAPDPLGFFLAVGITAMIALYAFVNAGITVGLFPVTGLPMPLVSWGGTAMVITGVMLGILLNISRHVES